MCHILVNKRVLLTMIDLYSLLGRVKKTYPLHLDPDNLKRSAANGSALGLERRNIANGQEPRVQGTCNCPVADCHTVDGTDTHATTSRADRKRTRRAPSALPADIPQKYWCAVHASCQISEAAATYFRCAAEHHPARTGPEWPVRGLRDSLQRQLNLLRAKG